MPLFSRRLIDYFPNDLNRARTPLNEPPATTFLKEAAHICDSINHCARHFPKRQNEQFTSDSSDSFQRLSMAAFALLLSHFEKFQKAQFAVLLNSLNFLTGVDDTELVRRLEKVGCVLSLLRIITGRGDPREPGEIIADSLPGWHSPERVNGYFRTMFPTLNMYSNEVVEELELLWQLRHSIVHTGGVITREDAIKVPSLRRLSEKQIIFSQGFITTVGRRMHIVVQVSMQQLEVALRRCMPPDLEEPESFVETTVGYSSPRKSWFRGNSTNAVSEIGQELDD